MTQRNVELQLQALELIEQKYGITPESFKPQKSGYSKSAADDFQKKPSKTLETQVMQDVIEYV